jgi:hypothetical protein
VRAGRRRAARRLPGAPAVVRPGGPDPGELAARAVRPVRRGRAARSRDHRVPERLGLLGWLDIPRRRRRGFPAAHRQRLRRGRWDCAAPCGACPRCLGGRSRPGASVLPRGRSPSLSR